MRVTSEPSDKYPAILAEMLDFLLHLFRQGAIIDNRDRRVLCGPASTDFVGNCHAASRQWLRVAVVFRIVLTAAAAY